ncbi:MAG: ATP-binding protein [Pseudomonadota bacterium]
MPNLSPPETIAELRDLYRSAEARAARLRILVDTGRDLASATSETLENVLQSSAKRAAYLAGYKGASIHYHGTDTGTPLRALGADGRQVGTLVLEGSPPANQMDREDAEAFQLLCHLIATAIDRAERERRLEHVVSSLFSAQEDERRRVSQDLHDGVAQTASAIFRRLELRSEKNKAADAEDLELADMARGLVKELRQVIAGLRPTMLDDLGLAPALEALAQGLQMEGFQVNFSARDEGPWPDMIATAFYRVGQEALTNVRKHAGGPCRVEISLFSDPADDSRRLIIKDHGQGLPENMASENARGDHLGLQVMQERMMAIGGSITIKNGDKGGVIVDAALPGTGPK